MRWAPKLGITAAKLGLGYNMEGVQKFVGVVGASVAANMMHSATLFDAAIAHVMGLVNRVVPLGDLDKTVRTFAATIAANAR
jgi:enoyl-CoA hydratase/carnithine racemase